MAGQTISDRLLAARHSLAGQGLAKSVCKATTEEMISPKKKHLDCKFFAISILATATTTKSKKIKRRKRRKKKPFPLYHPRLVPDILIFSCSICYH